MAMTKHQPDDSELYETLVQGRREKFALTFSRFIALGAGALTVGIFGLWLIFRQHAQLFPVTVLMLQLTIWSAAYPLFLRRGHPTAGSFFIVASLIVTSIGCFVLLPEARLGAVSGLLIAATVANLVFGKFGGRWTSGISLVLLAGGILLVNSVPLPMGVPLAATPSLFLNLFIMVIPFFVICLIIYMNTAEQENYFRETKRSTLEIERRIAAEQEQRERLQQANLEIERGAETERAQRKTLAEMLIQAREVTINLKTTAAEILAATTQQASGTSEQSAAIAQTTTTVDEVKAIAEQSTERAQEVVNASQHALQVSQAGQTAVQETIASMNLIKERVEGIAENVLALSEQTQQIGEIISTVSDIASQSNMLALNASVEAARAGEHGKGFSVVAAEVRSLAEQSRAATIQVKSIIGDIQRATNATVMATEEGNKGVDQGLQRVIQARSAIETLGSAVNDNALIAQQLFAGGRQQQTGMEQIAVAMQNINQATVQNLNSTRMTEKAAQSLSDLARDLAVFVEKN